MARRRTRNYTPQRDVSIPSLRDVLRYELRPAPLLIPLPSPTTSQVRQYGDRRLFRPDRIIAPPPAVTRASARVVASSNRSFNTLRFADPKLVTICARRKERREVLFAKRLTRKGSGSSKRNNFWSRISCSRR